MSSNFRRFPARLVVVLLGLSFSRTAGVASAPLVGPAAALLAAIPPRDASALPGSELVSRLAGLSVEERDRALVEQILQGNVPSFLRHLQPVSLSLDVPGGGRSNAVVWVTPDYLAVGSDEDYVRVPLGLDAALAVARRFGCTLPTTKLVDHIYLQAERKLNPQPMPPCPAMTSVDYFRTHNHTIDEQLRGVRLGALVSGDKKDLVLSRRLAQHPGKVAIYGWHRPDGRPIQPLSTVHEAAYADYSHGIRLVSDTVLVDGQTRSIFDLLEDGQLVSLLSNEGVDRDARRFLAPVTSETIRAALQ